MRQLAEQGGIADLGFVEQGREERTEGHARRYGDFATADKSSRILGNFPRRDHFPNERETLIKTITCVLRVMGEILKIASLLAGVWLCASPVAASAANLAPFADPPAVDPAAVASPDLQFTLTAEDQEGFDKYFFFHRASTDFATAYADLNECDSFARAVGPSEKYDPVSSPVWAMQQQMIAQYGMAGAAGGAIGGIIGGIIAAEMAAAEQRKMRRKTMLTCMGFKEYQAYGAPKQLWQTFNSDSTSIKEEWRVQYLQMQAKLASGPKPSVGQIK